MKKLDKKVYKMTIDENDSETGVFALSLVENPAIEELFVYLSKEQELVKLATVNQEKRIILGPALIPNMEIPRIDEAGEDYYITFPEETVEKAAELFMLRQNNNNATIEHSESVDDISVVESWLIEDPKRDKSNVYGMEFPKSTWMVKMKINNDDVWENYIKTGKVKGISLEGIFSHSLVEMSSDTELLAKEKLAELKKVLEEYLETVTNISTSYTGATGSLQ
jgi:hypothetical protein